MGNDFNKKVEGQLEGIGSMCRSSNLVVIASYRRFMKFDSVVWRNCAMPSTWKYAIIFGFHEGTEHRTMCGNFRSILLLSTV